MRMLVLGAGLQGSACAYDLLQNDEVENVILADLQVDALPAFLQKYRDYPKLERVRLDARDHAAVRALMGRVDACMNALPYFFNADMARLAVECGVHYADLGGNTEIVFQQMELDDKAKAQGVSVVPDCGVAPGMVNILAAEAMRQLDSTDSVKIFVGGLPQAPEPPLNYQIVYSLQGVLDYYTTMSYVVENGVPVEKEALSEVEHVEFPAPVGTLEAFHTAGGLSTMAWTYEGQVRSMQYKTLRYPGHAAIMKAIRDLGLLDTTPIKVGDIDVAPRDVFIARVEPLLKKPGSADLVALRVVAEGEKDGAPRRIQYDLIDYFDEAAGISAMERTTGYSLSITGQMQVRGETAGAGVYTPDQAIPAAPYIDALGKRGIRIRLVSAAGTTGGQARRVMA